MLIIIKYMYFIIINEYSITKRETYLNSDIVDVTELSRVSVSSVLVAMATR
jgi:hypothetical protein